MKTVVPMIVVGAIALVILWLTRGRMAKSHTVTASDVRRILQVMSTSTAMPTFAALVFNTPDRPSSDDAVNVQFSMENGRLGFDWVLLATRNIEDKDRFIQFAHACGFSPQPTEMNGVKYLRVEEGDIGRICIEVITRMYNLPAGTTLTLIPEGFSWAS